MMIDIGSRYALVMSFHDREEIAWGIVRLHGQTGFSFWRFYVGWIYGIS